MLVGYIRKCAGKASIGIVVTNEEMEINGLSLSKSTATRYIADSKRESWREIRMPLFPIIWEDRRVASDVAFFRPVAPEQRTCYHLLGSILPNLEATDQCDSGRRPVGLPSRAEGRKRIRGPTEGSLCGRYD